MAVPRFKRWRNRDCFADWICAEWEPRVLDSRTQPTSRTGIDFTDVAKSGPGAIHVSQVYRSWAGEIIQNNLLPFLVSLFLWPKLSLTFLPRPIEWNICDSLFVAAHCPSPYSQKTGSLDSQEEDVGRAALGQLSPPRAPVSSSGGCGSSME